MPYFTAQIFHTIQAMHTYADGISHIVRVSFSYSFLMQPPQSILYKLSRMRHARMQSVQIKSDYSATKDAHGSFAKDIPIP